MISILMISALMISVLMISERKGPMPFVWAHCCQRPS